MAAAFTLTRIGSSTVPTGTGYVANSETDPTRAEYETIFDTTVMSKMYEMFTVTTQMSMVETIPNGTGKSFRIVGEFSTSYHTPGEMLAGQSIDRTHRYISVDPIRYAAIYIDDLDAMMSSTNEIALYATKLGHAMGKALEHDIISEIMKGSRAPAYLLDTYGGTEIKSDDFALAAEVTGGSVGSPDLATWAQAIADALAILAGELDMKNVPKVGRKVLFSPSDYRSLLAYTNLINKDINGRGSLANGTIDAIQGFEVQMSTELFRDDTTSTNPYHGVDATKIRAIAFTEEAVATVQLRTMTIESDRLVNYQADFMSVAYAMGHGYYRPECCAALSVDTISWDSATSKYVLD